LASCVPVANRHARRLPIAAQDAILPHRNRTFPHGRSTSRHFSSVFGALTWRRHSCRRLPPTRCHAHEPVSPARVSSCATSAERTEKCRLGPWSGHPACHAGIRTGILRGTSSARTPTWQPERSLHGWQPGKSAENAKRWKSLLRGGRGTCRRRRHPVLTPWRPAAPLRGGGCHPTWRAARAAHAYTRQAFETANRLFDLLPFRP
jgi:hypothetical protein